MRWRWATAGSALAGLVAAPVVFMAVTAAPAGAAVVSPTTTADGGAGSGSLRDVLQNGVSPGDTVVLQAGATYMLDAVQCAQITVNTAVTIEGNGATVTQNCPNRRILRFNADTTLRNLTLSGANSGNTSGAAVDLNAGSTWSLNHVQVVNNHSTNDAGGVRVNTAGALTVSDSTFSGNTATDDGGAIDCNQDGATINVMRSTLSGNSTTQAGGQGGAIDLESACTLTLVNSTVTGNTSADLGAISGENSADQITIVYSDIVNNTFTPGSPGPTAVQPTAGEKPDPQRVGALLTNSPANIAIDTPANLTVFGSVIAQPHNGPNCGTVGTGAPLTGAVSQGSNFVDDASCGLATATDKQNAGDPKLGALAANGGPTLTLLPLTGSPLIDAIPTAACQTGAAAGVTTDQRGVTRPQGPGCEIGSVELQVAAIVVTPRFTG